MRKLIIGIFCLWLVGCDSTGESSVPDLKPSIEIPEGEREKTYLGKTTIEWVAWHNQKLIKGSALSAATPSLCDTEERDTDRLKLWDLNETYKVLEIQCNRYAYQSDFVLYVYDKKAPNIEAGMRQLSFDQYVGQKQEHTRIIMEARFDPVTQTLTTLSKGRGLGDCGNTALYRWTDNAGGYFYLTEARGKETCEGYDEGPWPVIYQKIDPSNPGFSEGHVSPLHPSWDTNQDGLNDCAIDGDCDHTIDYLQPRLVPFDDIKD